MGSFNFRLTHLKTALSAGLFVLAGALAGPAQPAMAQATVTPITPAVDVQSNISVSAVVLKHTASTSIEASPAWKALSAADQAALAPMQHDWANLDASRKKKWLAVAKRYQTMSAADQGRMHQRMGQWAKLTPAQRSQARDNYSAVLSSPSSSGDSTGKGNLNEQWNKYQALPPEKRAQLTEQTSKPAQ